MTLPASASQLTPARMAAALDRREGFVWMDSSLPQPGAVSVLTAEPIEVLRGHIERDWKLVRAALSLPRATRGGLYGWVGYDVTHATLAGDELCRLAVGRDYADASPVRGVRHGGGGEELGVVVTVAGQ